MLVQMGTINFRGYIITTNTRNGTKGRKDGKSANVIPQGRHTNYERIDLYIYEKEQDKKENKGNKVLQDCLCTRICVILYKAVPRKTLRS